MASYSGLLPAVLILSMIITGRALTDGSGSSGRETKSLKICSLLGGLDLTRLRSFTTRNLFKEALEDVELLREYVSEAMTNDGLRGGMSDLEAMAATLDWEGRGGGLGPADTTLTAGLGWADDRRDRRVERKMSTVNEPRVGTKQTDMAAVDAASNVLPWLLDRRSREALWRVPHQNGRTEGPGVEPPPFDRLYEGTWALSWGDATAYFPPLRLFGGGSPLTLPDIVGGDQNTRVEPFVVPSLEESNPGRNALFIAPYADVAQAGVSMISAIAPIYYTGLFRGFSYNDTFLGTCGVDIALEAVADMFDDLKDALADRSFALLVESTTFAVVSIGQGTVRKIYPERTGFEEERVVRQSGDGKIVLDRRNQTYLVRDTIWQPLVAEGVVSADWEALRQAVMETPRGERGHIAMNLTLTGRKESELYYAMFDRWAHVSDWALLVLAPVAGVDGAVDVSFAADAEGEGRPRSGEGEDEDAESSDIASRVVTAGKDVSGRAVLRNRGTLDVIVAADATSRPPWIRLTDPSWREGGAPVGLRAGESVVVDYVVRTAGLADGTWSKSVVFHVSDDGYPDCFHSAAVSFDVSVRVTPEPKLNQIGAMRAAGLVLMAAVLASSVGFGLWVVLNRTHGVVRCSQPLFLVTICCGTFLMGSTIALLSVDDEVASTHGCSVACMVSPWLLSTGFTMTFSALFSKIWRINKIMQAAGQFRKIKVSEKDVLLPFAVLFTINFVLLLVWTLVDPLHWARIPVHGSVGERGIHWNTYGTCTGGSASTIFGALVLVVNFCALALASFEAYRARGISDELSESKYIALSLASSVQVFVVGVPLLFLVSRNPPAGYFVKSALIFVLCLSINLLIFVPKIVISRKRKSGMGSGQDTLNKTRRFSGGQDALNESRFSSTSRRSSADSDSDEHPPSEGIKIVHMDMDAEVRRHKEKEKKLEAQLQNCKKCIQMLEEELLNCKEPGVSPQSRQESTPLNRLEVGFEEEKEAVR